MIVNILIKLFKICVNIYIYIYNYIIYLLPEYILLNVYQHKTEKHSFSVYEYIYNHKSKKRIYKFKFIESDNTKCVIDIKLKDIENINSINYCGIIDDAGESIIDITEDIKKFIHLKNKIHWRYILTHLNLHNNYDKYIYINLNDDDLTSKKILINDISEEIFTI